MRIKTTGLGFIVASVSLLACSTPAKLGSGFLPTHPARAPIAPGQVELVFGGHVAQPYSELGVATTTLQPARGIDRSWTGNYAPPTTLGYRDMLAELRAIGARNGCDAMLVNPTTFVLTTTVVTAVCIAYNAAVASAPGSLDSR